MEVTYGTFFQKGLRTRLESQILRNERQVAVEMQSREYADRKRAQKSAAVKAEIEAAA